MGRAQGTNVAVATPHARRSPRPRAVRAATDDAVKLTASFLDECVETEFEGMLDFLTDDEPGDVFLELAEDLQERNLLVPRWQPTGPAGRNAVLGGFDFDRSLLYAGPVRSRKVRFGHFLAKRMADNERVLGGAVLSTVSGTLATAGIVTLAAHGWNAKLDGSSLWLTSCGAVLSGYITQKVPERVRRRLRPLGRLLFNRPAERFADLFLRDRPLVEAAQVADREAREQVEYWGGRAQGVIAQAAAAGEDIVSFADYGLSVPLHHGRDPRSTKRAAQEDLFLALQRHDLGLLAEVEVAARLRAMRAFASEHELFLVWSSAKAALHHRSLTIFTNTVEEMSGRADSLRVGTLEEARQRLEARLGRPVADDDPRLATLEEIRSQGTNTAAMFDPRVFTAEPQERFEATVRIERHRIYGKILDAALGSGESEDTPFRDSLYEPAKAQLRRGTSARP